MSQPGTVIKANQVVLGEPFRLGSASAASAPTAGLRAASPAAGKARVVEQSESAVVIEVTCDCGQKIYVQCDF